MPRSLPALPAVPYPWPYHGHLCPERLALVACLDEQWRPAGTERSELDPRLGELVGTVRRAGGIVVGLVPPTHGPSGGEPALDCDQVVVASAVDGFFGTPLDGLLRSAGRTDLILCGWGLEGPIHSTLRSANDRGYECLLLTDGSIPVDPELAPHAIDSVRHSGGIFGAYAPISSVLAAFGPTPAGSPTTDPTTSATLEQPMPEPIEHPVQLAAAEPYPWPYDGTLLPERTALINIDWQVDFCGPGGYVDQMGYDLSLTRSGLEPTRRVLDAVREWGGLVVHTREGHRPDLSDCPPNKLWRSKRIGAGIGDASPCGRILVRGERGWEIVPEVAPIFGEVIIDKPGKGAFYATDLDLVLRTAGITHIVLTGITTDVCVHTTMREANDRGYECLLLSDCTGATDPGNYAAALEMVKMQGGVFGAVCPSTAFIDAIAPTVATAGVASSVAAS
jgi:nicotinamidase-related amidase